jgi:hypothetical protein
MRYSKIATFATVLLSTAAVSNLAVAKSPNAPSSSTIPGQEMQATPPGDRGADRGASEYSPGDQMRDSTGATTPGKSDEPGASGYAPGDSISNGKK